MFNRMIPKKLIIYINKSKMFFIDQLNAFNNIELLSI